MNWTDLPFAGFLLVLSGLMLFWHMASWKEVSRSDLPAAAFEFHYRRHRRRSLASALIGFVGLAIICGMWVGDGWQPIAYWSVVAIIVLWIACLAMADLSIPTKCCGKSTRITSPNKQHYWLKPNECGATRTKKRSLGDRLVKRPNAIQRTGDH